MAVEPSFPTSVSSLLLPSASQNFSSTLSSLKRSTLSATNRLHSIRQDSLFVQNVASNYSLPLVANERCGSWYIPPELKAGSAYFKSTDGHWGQWYSLFGIILPCCGPSHKPQDVFLEQTPALTPRLI